MTDFTKEVLHIIKNIPRGKVMSYGQIAKIAGSPKGARQVSRILHSMSQKHSLPWHRVVSKDGKIVIVKNNLGQLQIQLLESEGVAFNHLNQIDMNCYGFESEAQLKKL